MSKKIVVKTPATSANLGSGFDCLAIALDIFNINVTDGQISQSQTTTVDFDFRVIRCQQL